MICHSSGREENRDQDREREEGCHQSNVKQPNPGEKSRKSSCSKKRASVTGYRPEDRSDDRSGTAALGDQKEPGRERRLTSKKRKDLSGRASTGDDNNGAKGH